MESGSILQKLRDNLPEFRKRGITRLAVFGSVVRGATTHDSDVDILVRIADDRKTFDNFMEIKFFLEELFPNMAVDLVLEEALKPAIRDRILSEAYEVA